MQVFRGFGHRALLTPSGHALTIGNFDGVHRGHQAMLALLTNEARHRGLPSCVLTFEPHPRDFFAERAGQVQAAPRRISTLRDKLAEIERCGVDRVVVLRFDAAFAGQLPQVFVERVLVRGVQARYVLVGDDFSYGAKRAGSYATLDEAGRSGGFDVARMMSYEVHGLRVSSSAVRESLAAGDLPRAEALLGRPYAISGHVLHGRKLGRELGFRTLNLRFGHPRPAAAGIFVVRVHGLGAAALGGVASLGVRPTVEDSGRMLLEAHVFDWPASLGAEGGYGRVVRVELLHKMHDEVHYDSLGALARGIAADTSAARQWWLQRAAAQNR
ncbi:MAG: bifunctional riboflavin kinase/FAD synthetase [Rubrivivax sp.]|nr:bifunctional riboflavin kinase/FAD synthetase [Rubrivivax sp.]